MSGTKIRYDFWSLIAALQAGLTHGGTAADERAKSVVDAVDKMSLEELQAKEKQLGVVADYLGAIQRRLANRKDSAAKSAETVALPNVKRKA